MIKISPPSKCEGTLIPPPDKSISHRALILSSIASEESEIDNLSEAEDVKTTRKALILLGKKLRNKEKALIIEGGGFPDVKEGIVDCRNSGTTARLIMGLLAPERVSVKITGDDSLVNRPMERVISPLKMMGAHVSYLDRFGYLPVNLTGKKLHGIRYELPVVSAQVKSALLIAALRATSETTIIEPHGTRDHTERMLSIMDADVEVKKLEKGSEMKIAPGPLSPLKIKIPGDFSSAAYFIALAVLRPARGLMISGVNLNPTRLGFLEALREMGADMNVDIEDVMPEPKGKVFVRGGELKAISIDREHVPFMIDELPLLAVVATQAHGRTVIKGAEELRVKEADRIGSLVNGLKSMGAQIEALEDGFTIEGPTRLNGATLDSHGDHRLAMCFTIAASLAGSYSTIEHEECVSISYPHFYKDFQRLAC